MSAVSYIKILHESNSFYNPDSSKSFCKCFYIDNKHVGFIRPDVLAEFSKCPDIFDVRKNERGDVTDVYLAPHLNSYKNRSAALAKYLEDCRNRDVFITLRGWRNECYEVRNAVSDPPLLEMERAATCLFGVRQYGVHINGFLRHSTKGLCMWIGKRAMHKATWPGKLDQMVAGGIASGQSIMDCAQKECEEEASVPEHLVQKLKPVGTVSYFYEDERGLFPECQFVMDLEVPEDFVPVNSDGEVGSFELLPIEEVKRLILTDAFKFNCRVVVLHFLIRHGLIDPDQEPNYSRLVEMMSDTPYS